MAEDTEIDTYDTIVYIGDTWQRNITYKVSAVAVNLTGYDIRAKMRKANNTTLLADMSIANGGVIETDLVNGVFDLILTATQTSLMNGNKALDDGLWDLEVEAADGTVTKLFQGTVTLDTEATY